MSTDGDEAPDVKSIPADETHFEYDPLQSNTHFRLVRLSSDGPQHDEADIHCTLVAVDRLERRYTAVSHVWGPAEPERTIFINQKPFSVRPNLFHFLRSLRQRKEPEWLWIDALCIDQASLGERNHQVAQMKSVYEGAARVYAWLGPSTPALVGLFQSMIALPSPPVTRDEAKRRYGGRFLTVMAGLHELSRCEYWQRLWVTQEYCLARSVVIMAGTHTTSWEKLHSHRDVVRDISPHLGDAIQSRAAHTGASEQSFEYVFYSQKNKLCTIDQDKVYAILGMTDSDDDLVDYSQQPAQLLLKLLNHFAFRSIMYFVRLFAESLHLDLGRMHLTQHPTGTVSTVVYSKWSAPTELNYTTRSATINLGTATFSVLLVNTDRPKKLALDFIPLTNWEFAPLAKQRMGNQVVLLAEQGELGYHIIGLMARNWDTVSQALDSWRWTSFLGAVAELRNANLTIIDTQSRRLETSLLTLLKLAQVISHCAYEPWRR